MKQLAASFFVFLFVFSKISCVLGQNIVYVNPNDDAAFSRSIDEAKAVGVIPGIANVTPSGGASYTIPIAIPPGTNGLVPEIALVYNSQSGNSIAGYGWTIAGLSSISRVQKNSAVPILASAMSLS